MPTARPIIYIDDDEDDRQFYAAIFQAIAPEHPLVVFSNGQQAFDYLRGTQERPFLIVAEVRLNTESGLDLRRRIEADPALRQRAIPFVFLTHPLYRRLVEEAYELIVQGLFEKTGSVENTHRQLRAIVNYWADCVHPNKF